MVGICDVEYNTYRTWIFANLIPILTDVVPAVLAECIAEYTILDDVEHFEAVILADRRDDFAAIWAWNTYRAQVNHVHSGQPMRTFEPPIHILSGTRLGFNEDLYGIISSIVIYGVFKFHEFDLINVHRTLCSQFHKNAEYIRNAQYPIGGRT